MTLLLSFDDIDDPELDIASARVESGTFVMDGRTDWQWGGRRHRRRGRHRVRLIATMVDSFSLSDDADAGVLIPERIDVEDGRVHITGVIPATLTLHTMGRSDIRFEVSEEPYEVRRRFAWVPA